MKFYKKIMKVWISVLCLLVVCTSPVLAAENSDTDISINAGARTINDGSYTFSSTTTVTLGTQYISSNSKLVLTMEKSNSKLIQGTVYFIPMSGGNSINKAYSNYSTNQYIMDLSDLTPGTYMVKLKGSPVGTSSVKVQYHFQ